MEKNRAPYGYWDLPTNVDQKGAGIDATTCEALIDEFITLAGKGIHQQYQRTTAYEAVVRKLIPKHNLTVKIEQANFNYPGHLKLPFIGLKRKDYEDIFFQFKAVVFTFGFGLFEYSVHIGGSPDTIDVRTGKPKQ